MALQKTIHRHKASTLVSTTLKHQRESYIDTAVDAGGDGGGHEQGRLAHGKRGLDVSPKFESRAQVYYSRKYVSRYLSLSLSLSLVFLRSSLSPRVYAVPRRPLSGLL